MSAKRVKNADPSSALPADVLSILESVIEERDRAMAKWGVQNHPDGTGGGAAEILRDQQRDLVDKQSMNGKSNWRDILLEEVREAFAETDLVALDKELMQVMQVCCVWREDIARRSGTATLSVRGDNLPLTTINAAIGTTNEEHDGKVKEALEASSEGYGYSDLKRPF